MGIGIGDRAVVLAAFLSSFVVIVIPIVIYMILSLGIRGDSILDSIILNIGIPFVIYASITSIALYEYILDVIRKRVGEQILPARGVEV